MGKGNDKKVVKQTNSALLSAIGNLLEEEVGKWVLPSFSCDDAGMAAARTAVKVTKRRSLLGFMRHLLR